MSMGNGSEVISELFRICCCHVVSVLKIHEDAEKDNKVAGED